MNIFQALWTYKEFRYYVLGFASLAVAVAAFLFWLDAHDARIRLEVQNEIISQPPIIEIRYRDTPIPVPKPQPPQKKTGTVILKSEHQRLLDSVSSIWKKIGADKDSLLDYYTQIKAETFEDTVGIYFLTMNPLAIESFMFQPVYKERTMPVPYATEINYIPETTPWYLTPTATFCYGILTAGAIFIIVK